MSKTSLNNEQVHRYGRQLILPDFGVRAQEKLCAARVLVIGAGGLGAPVCLYLAAAGVNLGIVDDDVVEKNNLHRQIIHSELQIGSPKVLSARNACLALNSSITVTAHLTRFSRSSAIALSRDYQILVDCSDNVPTRYLVNDVGVILGKPVVSGSALGTEGRLTVFDSANGTPCLRCVHPAGDTRYYYMFSPYVSQRYLPSTQPSCADAGVLGPVVGVT
jgi:adenylyltransferase/sulfurtransferase